MKNSEHGRQKKPSTLKHLSMYFLNEGLLRIIQMWKYETPNKTAARYKAFGK